MKKFLCVATLLIVLVCILASCGHEHVWQEVRVIKEETCIDEGEGEKICECGKKESCSIPPSQDKHNYVLGCCTLCDDVSEDTLEALEETVSSLYAIAWILNDYGSLDGAARAEAEDAVFADEKYTVSGEVIVKTKDGKYYRDDFKYRLKYNEADGKWVFDSSFTPQYSDAPLECYEDGEVISYCYTKNPSFTHKSGYGREKTTISFDESKATMTFYNYYGLYDSSLSMRYELLHAPTFEYILLHADELDSSNNDLIAIVIDTDTIFAISLNDVIYYYDK